MDLFLRVFTLLIGLIAVAADLSQVSPVSKVIQMMEQMLEKAKDEKHKEEVQFSAYSQFCKEKNKAVNKEIETARQMIDVLKADIGGYAAKAARMSKRIAKLDEEIAQMNLEKKEAIKVRTKEHDAYEKMHVDYTESIDALGRAIVVLKKQDYSRPQALIQLKDLKSRGALKLMDSNAEKVLDSFLAGSESMEMMAMEAPEAHGYEFQSSGVVEMLEKLQDKFQAELRAAERTEMLTEQNFDLLIRDKDAAIAQKQKDRDQSSGVKSKNLKKKASAQGDHKDTTQDKDADKAYVRDLVATCAQKAKDYEVRQQVRTEEIAAIEKAMSIITSGAVKGASEKHLPSLVQVNATSLVVSKVHKVDAQVMLRTREKLMSFLRSRANTINSKILLMAADKVSADPFRKVKNMIKDMINKLLEEANEEAEHKGWCDTELSTNKKTRTEKTETVEKLSAEEEELQASISKLTDDVSSLLEGIKELDSSMAEATELRLKEKSKNEETIADAIAAQTAVAQAVTVLNQFYEKAGESTAFTQKQPEIFDKSYTGLTSDKGGILGMLEVIQSDFARLESETKSAEASAVKEYDQFMMDSKTDKADKTAESDHKEAKKQDQTQEIASTKEDMAGTQKELNAALKYFDKLKPSCVDAGVSYEDRVARRKSEIESLQQSLKILQGDDIA